MLEIWWVRHGTTDWNAVKRWQGHTDLPLNENGRQLAARLAPRLKGIPFDECWSSDLRRSWETAQIALPGRKIELDCRLREVALGHLEGKTWDEVSPEVHREVEDWWKNPFEQPFPGSDESLGDASARVRAWRLERPREGRIIVFTHGGIIRCAVWDVVGRPCPEHPWSMEVGNTGIVRLRYGADSAALVCLNDMSHIENSWNCPPTQNLPGSR